MIVKKHVAGGSKYNAGLFAVNGNIFEKDVTVTATADGGTVFPNFYTLACLWSLLNDKVGC